MKKTRILTRHYGVSSTIVLTRNIFKARRVNIQHYTVTIHKVYAVNITLWNDIPSYSALRRNKEITFAVTSVKSIIWKALDAVMLCVFPLSLTGDAKRWVDRLTLGPLIHGISLKSLYPKNLKENVHAIQVGCQTCEEPHLDKECPLNEEIKGMEEVKPNWIETINKYMEETVKRQEEHDEWLKKFCQSTQTSRMNHDKIIQNLKSKVKTLNAEVETKEIKYFSANSGFSNDEKQESVSTKLDNIITNTPEVRTPPPEQKVSYYVEPYGPPIPFPKRLDQHAEEALVHETMESLKKIRINRPLLKEIRQIDHYSKYVSLTILVKLASYT
nr:hypothetical protein [Tanacetum cinerariifolium]